MIKKSLLVLIFIGMNLYAEDKLDIKKIYLNSYNYEKMGLYDEAIKVLAPLYKKYPKGYTLNLRTGYLFLLSKHYSSALEYYKKASMIVPSSIEPRLAIANINLILHNHDKVEQITYNILKIDYYNYYGSLYLVETLTLQKKYDIALAVVDRMLYLYPTDVIFLEKLAILYKKMNNKNLDEVYKSIEILDPNNIFVNTVNR